MLRPCPPRAPRQIRPRAAHDEFSPSSFYVRAQDNKRPRSTCVYAQPRLRPRAGRAPYASAPALSLRPTAIASARSACAHTLQRQRLTNNVRAYGRQRPRPALRPRPTALASALCACAPAVYKVSAQPHFLASQLPSSSTSLRAGCLGVTVGCTFTTSRHFFIRIFPTAVWSLHKRWQQRMLSHQKRWQQRMQGHQMLSYRPG